MAWSSLQSCSLPRFKVAADLKLVLGSPEKEKKRIFFLGRLILYGSAVQIFRKEKTKMSKLMLLKICSSRQNANDEDDRVWPGARVPFLTYFDTTCPHS